MIASTASSTEMRNGIGNSFLSVSGVLTNPGLMTLSFTPADLHSGRRDSQRLIRAALVAP